jgi:hypothetical protein
MSMKKPGKDRHAVPVDPAYHGFGVEQGKESVDGCQLTITDDRMGVSHIYRPSFPAAVETIMPGMNREDLRAVG